MRIGVLTTSFPRLAGDVPGAFVLGFAGSLVALGHELKVLAPAPGARAASLPPQFPGITLQWVRYLAPRALERTFYGAGVLDNLRRDPLAAAGLLPFVIALARATRSELADCDALVSHWALPCALVAGSLRGTRRHLAVLHSADVFVLERLPFRRALATRIVRQAHALVFSSRDLRRRFLALLDPVTRSEHAASAHVCAMGIDQLPAPTEERGVLRARLGLTGFTLLSLGRLIPLKGIEHAIDALVSSPEVELVVVGDGPARAALEARARLAGARVRFVGEQRGAAKHAWFAAADAFVLPSIKLASGRTEGMPTTLLEAMQHGLPVIASDVGGVSDVVRDGENGLLVRSGSARAIAEALTALTRESTCARLREGALETAALYEWPGLGPHFLALLTGIDAQDA